MESDECSHKIKHRFVMTTSTFLANNEMWAVVVAQLVERSLPNSEVRGSNPVIGKILY